MTTYITAIHTEPSGSRQHDHITQVRWSQNGKEGISSRQNMVDFIDKGNAVFVRATPDVRVVVVRANPPYIRTQANGVATDNLINLPRF